jgi:hypothetical protein
MSNTHKWNKILHPDWRQRAAENWCYRSPIEWMAYDYQTFKAYMEGRLLETMIGDLNYDEREQLRKIALGHTSPTHIKKDADIQRPARMSGELFDVIPSKSEVLPDRLV